MAVTREEQAMQYFVSKGWSKQQAAGIVGNLIQESKLNTASKNPNSTATGIAQWTKGSGRYQNFQKRYGLPVEQASYEQQLDFVQYELTEGEYKRVGRDLAKETTASGAAVLVRKRYEIPGEAEARDDLRISYAKRLETGDYKSYEPAVRQPIIEDQTGEISPVSQTISNPAYSTPSTEIKPFNPELTGVASTVEVFGAGNIKKKTKNNILEQFSSYNCIFTISCLPPKLVNFPDAIDSYKNSKLGKIILRTSGGILEKNSVETGFKSDTNPKGIFDYFIDSLTIESSVAYDSQTRSTNAVSINFNVIEPYSMGIFLQTLELAARECEYFNYKTAPYLLTIEFIGYDSNGNIIPVDDDLNRHIPFQFSSVEMTVDSSGSKYEIQAAPWNFVALTDMYNILKEDMSISGTTVSEILQTGENSLQKWINTKLQHIALTGPIDNNIKATPDEVVILFPKVLDSKNGQIGSLVSDSDQPLTQTPTAASNNESVESKLTLTRGTTNMLMQMSQTLNEIGLSSMGYTEATGGFQPLSKDNEIQTADNPINRKNIFYQNDRSFHFPQGTTIVSAIEEILLMSEYCKKMQMEDGYVKWFRIETQVYVLEPSDKNASRGHIPKLMVYSVVPYLVHPEVFAPPTAAPDYDQLKNNVEKEYNYIYTGNNLDILNLEIKFNAITQTPIPADKLKYPQTAYQQSIGAGVETQVSPEVQLNSAKQSDPGVGVSEIGSTINRYKNSGGGPPDDYRSLIAKQFQQSLYDSVADNTSVDLEIMGDPYYLVDSGLGNFRDQSLTFNSTKNGSMNYQNGQVDILINYKTPVDYNLNTGILEDSGQYTTVKGFSGVYRISRIINNFQRGKFTQTISCTRRRNQNPEELTDENVGTNQITDTGSRLIQSPTQIEQKPSINSTVVGKTEPVLECIAPEKQNIENFKKFTSTLPL